jgi:hypothetical protein
MVSTRRSARNEQKKESPPEPHYEEVEELCEVEEATAKEEPQSVNGEASHKRSTRSTTTARRKRGEELRSKSTGVGISVVSEPVNKKIVFDEEILVANTDTKDDEPNKSNEEENDGSVESNDDDDAVEEVKGSAAKDLAEKQRERERITARGSLSKKSRKRKDKTENEIAEEFDDDFFKQLGEEREEERKQRKKSKKPSEPAGRHTAFVLSGDEDGVGSSVTPKVAEHNIEVVVLGTKDAYASDDRNTSSTGRSLLLEANNEPPSETVLMYSRRSLLADGSEPPSQKQLQKAQKAGHKTAQAPTWKRSKKITRILGSGVRQKGKAAAHFVVQM